MTERTPSRLRARSSRREWLRSAALLPGVFATPALALEGAPALVGCCALGEGGYGVAVLTQGLDLLRLITLPGRGHGVVVSPDRRTAVVLARRPGRFAQVIDLTTLDTVDRFETPAGRHFYGHGLFSPDGRYLYATENDYNRPASVLGVYAAGEGYRRSDEFDTGGIGAHEAVLMQDGQTIAVANGGIETHPDFPRIKLNLAEMRPSLCYLDRADGRLLEQRYLTPRWHQLSLRHLTQTRDGAIWIGGQFEGPGRAPLIVRHRQGQPLELVDEPGRHASPTEGFRGYIGSIATDAAGKRVVVTAPRGNRALTLNAQTKQAEQQHELADVCGAASGDRVVLSTGEGTVVAAGATPRQFAWAWDNHLVRV
ncbi:MAG: DUF1513 domain-containing protein [Pseudomonadota bacterium]